MTSDVMYEMADVSRIYAEIFVEAFVQLNKKKKIHYWKMISKEIWVDKKIFI